MKTLLITSAIHISDYQLESIKYIGGVAVACVVLGLLLIFIGKVFIKPPKKY